MNRRWIEGMLVLVLLSAGQSWGLPAATYTFVALGEATHVAVSGDEETAVIGTALVQGRMQAARFTVERAPQFLGTGPEGDRMTARGARSGRVVGQAAHGTEVHAVLVADGQVRDLGALPGAPFSSAACLSGTGDVAGFSLPQANQPPLPVRWPQGGAIHVLATLGGLRGFVEACNGPGDLAGQTDTADGRTLATLWRAPDFQPEVLHTLPASRSTLSRTLGLSDSREAVGLVLTAQGLLHGFSWTEAGGMVELLPLAGDTHAVARAVNQAGDRVGRSWNPDVIQDTRMREQAVLWGPDGLPLALQSRVPAGTPWPLRDAVGIGSDGVIVVTGEVDIMDGARERPQGVVGLLRPVAAP